MSDAAPVAMVTAASRGMGKAIVLELASAGYRLALMARSAEVDSLAKDVGGLALRGSVTDPDDLANLVDVTRQSYGRVDAVVNNTGHAPKGDLLALTDDDWHSGLDLLLLSVIRMTRLVTPMMLEQGGGAIVNISTFAAFEPRATFPVSAVLRAGLGSFTKLYADRYAADGIRMNNVLPGFVDSYELDDEWLAQIPMGRPGTVAEVAKSVRFLVSPDAGYITGQNLRVDGGITRSV